MLGGEEEGASSGGGYENGVRYAALNSVAQRSAAYQLSILDSGGTLATSVGIKCQAWRFGGGEDVESKPFTLIAGSGEWCVDYALRLKRELGADSTWVSSYNSELIAYVPSARVKAEGGMEAGEAMLEYRNPAPFGEEVEEVIVAKVHELVEDMKESAEREKKRQRKA